MSRLRRFLHIERSRAPAAAPAAAHPESATTGRFSGVERAGGRPTAAAPSGAELERFAPAPPPEASLELGGTPAGERPFTRCLRCGMDHHVLAAVCTGCGTPLDGPEQRDFNDRLWARQREEAAREEEAAAARREAQAQAEAELAARRRAMGEELAREVGQAERRRLGGTWGDGAGWGGPGVELGRVGELLQDPRVRRGLLVAAGVLAAALGIAALLGHGRALVGVVLVVLSILLGRRRRRWWW